MKNLSYVITLVLIFLSSSNIMADAVDFELSDEDVNAVRVFKYTHQDEMYQDDNTACSTKYFDGKEDSYKCIKTY